MSTTIACIQGFHSVMAHFGGPHWLMNDEDARAYASAVNNVARHYDIAVAQKTIDIANLIGLVAFFEGTRILYSRRPPPPRPTPRGQVFQFSPPGSPAPPAPPAADPHIDPTPEGGALH